MAQFPETQWTLIRRSGDTSTARFVAFSELARDYRPAVLAFFRTRLAAADAEDATQSFLAASFEHQWWARADVDVGSFRGFLLTLLHRHLGHLRRARRPLDAFDDHTEPVDPAPEADRTFDARFALLLTQRALEQLRARYRARDREALFGHLVRLLRDPPAHGELQQVAASMGLAANTLTVELKRLRGRLREAVHEQLRQLCADQTTFESEWAVLQDVLGSR